MTTEPDHARMNALLARYPAGSWAEPVVGCERAHAVELADEVRRLRTLGAAAQASCATLARDLARVYQWVDAVCELAPGHAGECGGIK